MAKGHGKSSATSATRKKHQKKVAAALGIDLDPSSAQPGKAKNKDKDKSGRGKKDGKKEPRAKVYIPPVKPVRAQPDPLEVGGLARRLPPELVVVLRNVGKKAQVTKVRALEELGNVWVERAVRVKGGGGGGGGGLEEREEREDGSVDVVSSLVEMVPAWMHYVPPLFIHPSRRIRILSISVHSSLLKITEVRDQILFYLKETATSEEVGSVLGSWLILVHDIEKTVGSAGKGAWDSFVRYPSATSNMEEADQKADGGFYMLDTTSKNAIFNFVQRTVMDPLGVYAYLNPPPASNMPTPPVTVPKNQRSGGGGKGGISKQQQLAAAIAAARKAGTEEGEAVRSKAEEYDESEVDRRARLRIGGVGGLKWFLELDKTGISDEVMELLKNPMMWTVLYHAEKAPFVSSDEAQTQGGGFGGLESFGFGQPNVRKAGWGLLMQLLESHKEHIASIIPLLSCAVLRSAWVERDTLVQGVMRQPLLMFIKEFPNCWDLELGKSYGTSADEDAGDEDEEDEEDEGEGEEARKAEKMSEEALAPKVVKSSLAYQEFLQFLQLGCSGNPVQGYPTVVIVLSTIPSSIIASSGTKTPLEDLFTSLWAALDGRALSSLHRAVTSAAFLSAILECVVFMTRRLIVDGTKAKEEGDFGSVLVPNEDADVREEAKKLVQTQFQKVWEEMKSGRLKVEERAGARLVGQNLESLGKVDSGLASGEGDGAGLFGSAWGVLKIGLRDAVKTNSGLVATFLKVLFDHFKEGTNVRSEVADLIHEVLGGSVQRLNEIFNAGDGESTKEDIKFLECMLRQFREGLFEDPAFAERFDLLARTHSASLLEFSPSLVFSYLTHRNNEEKTLELWHALLGVLVTMASDSEKTKKFASDMAQAVQKGILPSYLRPKADELDDIVGNLLGSVLNANTPAIPGDLEVVKAVLGAHAYFISRNGYDGVVETIVTAFNLHVELLLGGSMEDISLSVFEAPLALLDLVTKHTNAQQKVRITEEVLPNLFLFGYLTPECTMFGFDPASNVFDVAREIWDRETRGENLCKERREQVIGNVKVKLRDLLADTQVRPLPEDILGVLAIHGQKLNISLLPDLFPSLETLDGMLRQLPHDPIDYSLAVIDPLIPPDVEPSTDGPEATDSRGFSSYARIINALLRVFLEDRNLARRNLWALRHFIALSIYASDYQKVPAGVSPVFDARALAGLGEVIAKVNQVTAYLLLGSLGRVADGWRERVVKKVVEGKYGANDGRTDLEQLVVDVIRAAVESDSVLDTRVLKTVLEDVLEDLEAEEAEEWIGLARKLEKSAPQTSMTLIAAITETGAEPTRLDRYRNEQAAELLGIRPSKINTAGLLTLRRLAASAPDLECDVVFLPQNRAVNVVKACQGWVTSDDADVDEEVESAMTLIFEYLAPILQNVPGSHWEFIWDVLENNLENVSWTDNASLVTLARSLRLVISIEGLVKTNKPLKAEWDQRRKNVLEMIRDLALVKFDTVSPSLPRSICRELVLSILRELPESLMDENTLPKMCHLITDPSLEVQKTAYRVLQTAAQKRTEHLVIEAGVDTESTFKAQLPSELLDIVGRHVNLTSTEDEDEQQNVFGSLLGWMLVFDLFQNASFKVKSGYIEQLRNLDLVAVNFIPLFLALLHLEGGLAKAFKLDIWAVNEFYVDLFEPGTISIPLLTAHLYYRALLSVPSLIHSWLSDCKDRQLSTTITAYTSQYFSPVIIDVELAHVKGPAGQDLADDSMSVKVAAAVNEVLASYLVDEHQLEIKLKIPSDWPLHRIEVKDLKRVGVDENRWRAWILAVQQTIWSHNGRLTDGLSLFKKNVTLHFEGQVECAICYSIISVMDGSLPRKPCKTCKNKFHAGCLYKWFNTSHSSSCPLCRSDIM